MSTEDTDRQVAAQLIDLSKPLLEKALQKDFSVKGMSPWSVSRYKCLNKCPFQFYLRYVLSLLHAMDTAEEDYSQEMTEDSVRTFVGSLGHELLDDMLINPGKTFHDSLAEKDLSHIPEKFRGMVTDLFVPCTEFVQRIESFKQKYPVKKLYVEQHFAVDDQWRPIAYDHPRAYMRAKLDLTMVMDNEDVVTVDHKLGGDPSWGLRNYKTQLDTYGLFQVCYRKDTKHVTSGVHFIQAMDVLLDRPIDRDTFFRVTRNNTDAMIYNAVDAVKEDGVFKAVKSTTCEYCEVRDLCVKYRKPRDKTSTAGLLQPILEDSRKFLEARKNA
jgi:hypothetical protein